MDREIREGEDGENSCHPAEIAAVWSADGYHFLRADNRGCAGFGTRVLPDFSQTYHAVHVYRQTGAVLVIGRNCPVDIVNKLGNVAPTDLQSVGT